MAEHTQYYAAGLFLGPEPLCRWYRCSIWQGMRAGMSTTNSTALFCISCRQLVARQRSPVPKVVQTSCELSDKIRTGMALVVPACVQVNDCLPSSGRNRAIHDAEWCVIARKSEQVSTPFLEPTAHTCGCRSGSDSARVLSSPFNLAAFIVREGGWHAGMRVWR